MALVKLEDFYPDHHDISSEDGFDLDTIKHFDVYAQDDEKVGSVHDVLVDAETGKFRYYVLDTGFWIFGKKVLLPIGLAHVSYTDKRIDVRGLTKSQVEDLPNFNDLEKLDFEQEEQVRGVYRPMATTGTMADSNAAVDRDSYNYEQDAALYNLNDHDHQGVKLYEERLIANKQRQKVGEVELGKRVETQTTRVSVPIEKEKVVIERTTPTDARALDPGQANFQDGEVARMEVYEETPDIHKEAFVREEVKVKKVVDQEVVKAEEQIRREELDIDTQGRPIVDKQR